jgi:AAA domain/Bifunctional DNA primase/polymerase, N-terminal/Primase C terminal 1 (PriCT-1)
VDEEWADVLVEALRRYAGYGWAPIPLRGKVPLLKQWEQTTAPDDVEYAAGQWAEWGRRGHGMGLHLGASRLAVIENDADEARLQAAFGGELPHVPTVRSGGRSLHLYFRDEGYEPSSRDGLELRCGRQQCATPPTIHPDTGRPYVWLVPPWEAELVPVPRRVLDWFAQSGGRLFAGPVDDEIREKDPGRHKALLSLAGSMRHRGMSGDEIAVALLAVNQRRCKPPLPEEEVLRLAGDVARRYEPAPRDREQERIEKEAADVLDGDKPAQVPPPPRRKRQLDRRPIENVVARPVEWLIPGRVPRRALTLVAGVGGLGKSGLLLAWASAVTRAGRDVLIVSYEDAAAEVLRPRFEALGGDLGRLHELYMSTAEGGVSFPTDLPELDRHVAEVNAAMFLIDPVSASIDLKLDAHKDQDVRVVLGQLHRLADERALAGVLNAHLNKAPSADPYLRINGSTAFYNAARSVLTVTADPADPDLRRLIAHHKSNYGRLAAVQRWEIEPAVVESALGPIETMRMVFLEDADDVSREDVLAAPSQDKQTEAALLILAELELGRRLSADVKAAGIKRGISERTTKRAAQDLEVVVEEGATESGRVTFWSLPGGSGQTPSHKYGPTPSEPHNQAEQGGSGQILGEGVGPTLPCPNHPGRHVVVKRTTGLVYLACGCHLQEGEPR